MFSETLCFFILFTSLQLLMFGQLLQDLPVLSKTVSDALEKLEKALSGVPTDYSKDAELTAYLETAHERENLGKLWGCLTVEKAKLLTDDSGSTTVGPSVSAAASTPVASPRAAEDEVKTEPQPSPPAASDVTDGKDGKDTKPGSESTSVAGSGQAPLPTPPRRLSSTASFSKQNQTTGEQITSLLHEVAQGKNGMVVQNLSHLLSLAEMTELLEKFLSVETMKELDELLEMWKNSTAQIKLMVGGIGKSSQNLTTHLSNLAKQEEREKDKKRKQAESKEVTEVRKRDKAAAKKVKEQEATTPEIFQIGLDKLQETSIVPAMKDLVDLFKLFFFFRQHCQL